MNLATQSLISEAEVKKVAHLARLRLDEKNVATYTKSLSDILDMIAQINDKDTDNIAPIDSPHPQATMPLREDKVTETDQRALYQSIAPAVDSGLYLVPQVIE